MHAMAHVNPLDPIKFIARPISNTLYTLVAPPAEKLHQKACPHTRFPLRFPPDEAPSDVIKTPTAFN